MSKEKYYATRHQEHAKALYAYKITCPVLLFGGILLFGYDRFLALCAGLIGGMLLVLLIRSWIMSFWYAYRVRDARQRRQYAEYQEYKAQQKSRPKARPRVRRVVRR